VAVVVSLMCQFAMVSVRVCVCVRDGVGGVSVEKKEESVGFLVGLSVVVVVVKGPMGRCWCRCR